MRLSSLRSLLAGSVLTAGAFVAAFAVATPASATSLTVTDCSGSPTDTGSLPYAVANASPRDTVTFESGLSCPPSSPITVSSPIAITQPITITGPGRNAVAVSGGDLTQVLVVQAGTVNLSGITIEDGVGNDNQIAGGGIENEGTLTVSDTRLVDNEATDGGGIYNSGTLTVNDSTLSANNAQRGGGIMNYQGTLTVNDSTVSGNDGPMNGGGHLQLRHLEHHGQHAFE
jgi:hypothetical protein